MEAKKGEEVGEEGMNERFNQKFVDWMTENAREAILGLSEDDGDPASREFCLHVLQTTVTYYQNIIKYHMEAKKGEEIREE